VSQPPRTPSSQAVAARVEDASGDALLDPLIHLYILNRGVLLTQFHNMALMSAVTSEADADRHTEIFQGALSELSG
jgi:glutamate-1-semialdehyde 2,1-aminomutase